MKKSEWLYVAPTFDETYSPGLTHRRKGETPRRTFQTYLLGDGLPCWQLHGQTQIREATLSEAIQQHVFWLHVTVNNIHLVEVQDARGDLGGVVDDALHLHAFLHALPVNADVVDVVLEVSSVHQGHDQTQVGLGVVGVRQVDQEQAVDLLQNLLLQQGHLLSVFLLQAFLTQLLAGVNLACVLHLYSAHLERVGVVKEEKDVVNVRLPIKGIIVIVNNSKVSTTTTT